MHESSLMGPVDISTETAIRRVGLRQSLENCLIQSACWLAPVIIPTLPRSAVLALAAVLGNLAYWLMPPHKMRIALANLTVAYGDSLSKRAKRRIVWQSMCNLTRVTIDFNLVQPGPGTEDSTVRAV